MKTHFLDEMLKESVRTPMKLNAEKLSDQEKIDLIQEYFKKIMETLGLNLEDDSIKDTPRRIAKMYVKEIFSGLKFENHPKISTFLNKYSYGDMLVEKNITIYSTCEHHFLPIVGIAHVGYISSGKVIGLSKINRIVDYYTKRPQVQERMTIQIVEHLQLELNTKDVACLIDAKHLCVNSRGIRDIQSSTVTSEYGGKFKDVTTRRDFLDYIRLKTSSKV